MPAPSDVACLPVGRSAVALSNHWARTLVTCVVAALCVLPDSSAAACQCELFTPELPTLGATNVPTNTRIWDAGGFPVVSIVDALGDVPFRVSQVTAGMSGFRVITPERELAPNSPVDVRGADRSIARFTTGSGPDHDAPAKPRVTKTSFASFPGVPTCYVPGEPVHQFVFTLEGDGDLLISDVNGAGSLDDATWSGAVSSSGMLPELVFNDAICANFTAAPVNTFRFASVDLAGNFSGWTDTQPYFLPPVGMWVCGSAPCSNMPIGLALVAVALRRRRPVSR